MEYKKISEKLRIQLIDNLHAREHFPTVFDFEPYLSDPICASADVLPFVSKFGNGTYGVTAMDIWYPMQISSPEHCRKIREARKSVQEASSIGYICSCDSLYQLGDTELMLIPRDREEVQFFPTIRSAMEFSLRLLPMPFPVYIMAEAEYRNFYTPDLEENNLTQLQSCLSEIGEFRNGFYGDRHILAFLSRKWALYIDIWDQSEVKVFFDIDRSKPILPMVDKALQNAGFSVRPILV